MSTNVESKSNTAPAVSGSGSKDEFEGCLPKSVTATKVMSDAKSSKVWQQLYAVAGIANAGEDTKKSLRCAVYGYLAKNGTSPQGTYKGEVTSGRGTVLLASEIPSATGAFEVRQFARANAVESLRFFRKTSYLENDPVMRAKCEEFELSVSDVIALVDWFDIAIGLTPTERQAQKALKNYGITRARRSRGGKGMDEMREEHYDSALSAQGPERPAHPPAAGW